MSASDAARRIKEKFKLGKPPTGSETKGSLSIAAAPRKPGRKRKAERMAQLNLRVPEEIKDRVRILAARDRIEMSEIIIEGIALYEAKYGAAPKLEPSRRA
jgi:hypothetical protein